MTACEAVCAWEANCTGDTNCPTDCVSNYAMSTQCGNASDGFATCIRTNTYDCDAVFALCDGERQHLAAACQMATAGSDSCAFANDGACDDPGFCAPGTDATDCDNSCDLAYDGMCEEGAECAFGTDSADCNG